MRRSFWVPLLLFAGALILGVSACHLIFPYSDPDPLDGGPARDLALDGQPRDRRLGDSFVGDLAPQADRGGCALAIRPSRINDNDGDLSLALDPAIVLSPVANIPASGEKDTIVAKALDMGDEVSGFVLSAPSNEPSVDQAAVAVVERVKKGMAALGGSAPLLVSSGVLVTAASGNPSLVSLRLALNFSSDKKPTDLRKALLPYLVSRPTWKPQLLDVSYKNKAVKSLVLGLSVELRAGDKRMVVMGGIADKSRAYNRSLSTALALDDLSNGTAVATIRNTLATACDATDLAGLKPGVDLVFVVDESGSMLDDTNKISKKAKDIIGLFDLYQTDLRIAVSGMKAPDAKNPPKGGWGGKFCSSTSSGSLGDGGTDRFLASSESKTLASCLTNPPFSISHQAYGLANAYEAVTRHLPRQPGSKKDSTHVRSDAALSIVAVSDRAPESLKTGASYQGRQGVLSAADLVQGSCRLSNATSSALDTRLNVWKTLYLGQHSSYGADGKAVFHALGGVCFESCKATPETAWGYAQVAGFTGGIFGSLCQNDLWPTLQMVVRKAVAHGAPLKLVMRPVTSSTVVRYAGKSVSRSLKSGYHVDAATGAVMLVDRSYSRGARFEVSYYRWRSQ